ncbi:MAG: hypothetical protein HYZ65_15455 [Burkholderiales bacterium]|nr:hypothetical protein [Burkholderiales bacterium]
MSGIFSFTASLLVLMLIALGTIRKSRRLFTFAYVSMVICSLFGWYQYIFPAGLSPLFFGGTIATVFVLSIFFYAIYSTETVLVAES